MVFSSTCGLEWWGRWCGGEAVDGGRWATCTAAATRQATACQRLGARAWRMHRLPALPAENKQNSPQAASKHAHGAPAAASWWARGACSRSAGWRAPRRGPPAHAAHRRCRGTQPAGGPAGRRGAWATCDALLSSMRQELHAGEAMACHAGRPRRPAAKPWISNTLRPAARLHCLLPPPPPHRELVLLCRSCQHLLQVGLVASHGVDHGIEGEGRLLGGQEGVTRVGDRQQRQRRVHRGARRILQT